jgi:alanine or glycine:cation symporter, AGCS family
MHFVDQFFKYLNFVDNLFWGYIGFVLVISVGVFFTIKTKGYQFIILFKVVDNFREVFRAAKGKERGTHPLKLYFASIGGMVGIGNMVGSVTAISLGGPGALVWLWVASFLGMLIKYSEIYLGITYREPSDTGGYNGGPMYYLKHAFKGKTIPIIVCILLCIYGAEVYQFNILVNTVTTFTAINKTIVVILLLSIILYSSLGGVSRLSNFCTALMPPFLLSYLVMCGWIIYLNYDELIKILPVIMSSAFTGHAAVGGFAGSTFVMVAQQGISKAVYSGDIGIGYDSIVQSESKVEQPEKQARMAIFALFSDTFICTLSCLVTLVTGAWKTNLLPSEYVKVAFGNYFPHIDLFMVLLFFIAASTTIIGYLVIGLKCAKYISDKWGEQIYIFYSVFVLVFFAYHSQTKVILIMSVSGGLLILLNLIGVLKLRKKVRFA